MKHLLDTDAAIALIKYRAEAVEWLSGHGPSEVVLSGVTKAEFYYGARKSGRAEHNLGVLSRFFAPFVSLSFDDRAAEEYGMIRADLERAGHGHADWAKRSPDSRNRPVAGLDVSELECAGVRQGRGAAFTRFRRLGAP